MANVGNFNNAAAVGAGECSLVPFLTSLSPGIGVVLQYDCQPPAFGIFQGFQCGFVILSDYNGFPGLVRIAANRINAVSPFTGFFPGFGGCGCATPFSTFGGSGGFGGFGGPSTFGGFGGFGF